MRTIILDDGPHRALVVFHTLRFTYTRASRAPFSSSLSILSLSTLFSHTTLGLGGFLDFTLDIF